MASKYGKQNNSPRNGGTAPSGGSGTMTGRTTGVRMSNERRSDVTTKPSSKNPYPNGLA